MRALLVLAHPLDDSLCAHLARQTEAALIARGFVVDLLDLYAEGFEPALRPDERRAYYGTPAPDAAIVALQARLARAETVVLVFPTWWFSMPAMLKGWFDRVWSPGFAFSSGTPIRPLLTDLRSCLAITTLGSPWWVDRLVMRRPVRRVLNTALLGACAPRARFTMLSLPSAEAVETPRLAAFEARITAAITRL